MSAALLQLLRMVARERERQDVLHGSGPENLVRRSIPDGFQVLAEEVGEAARAFLESDVPAGVKELVEVAAVALAMAEAQIDNRGTLLAERDGTVIDPAALTPEQFEGAEAVQVWRIEAREGAGFVPLPYQFVLAYPSAQDAADSAAHAAAATLEACGVKLSLVRVVKGPEA